MSKLRISLNVYGKMSLTTLSRIGKCNGYFYKFNWPNFSFEYILRLK